MYLRWARPDDIVLEFQLSDRSVLYLHARATELDLRRNGNLRAALASVIERIDEVKLTASAVVAAVRAFSRISDDGRWIDPNYRVVVTRESSLSAAGAGKLSSPSAHLLQNHPGAAFATLEDVSPDDDDEDGAVQDQDEDGPEWNKPQPAGSSDTPELLQTRPDPTNSAAGTEPRTRYPSATDLDPHRKFEPNLTDTGGEVPANQISERKGDNNF